MRIGIVSQPIDPLPADGGSSIGLWVQEVGKRLAEEHDVTAFSRKNPAQLDEEMQGKLRHVRIPVTRDEILIQRIRYIERFIERRRQIKLVRTLLPRRLDLVNLLYYFAWCYYFFYAIAIARHARRERLDTLVVTNYAQFLLPMRWICPNTTLVLLMQCDWLIQLPRGKARRRARRADLILGCSTYIVRGISERFPSLAGRCHTLHNGSSMDALGALDRKSDALSTLTTKTNAQTLLFVGRVTPEKGLHILVEALCSPLLADHEVQLLVAGDFAMNPPNPATSLSWWGQHPDEFESMKKGYREYLEVLSTPLAGRVKFLGKISHGELAILYESSDLFIHPSLWPEPFGMILTEAMLCGRAVLSTRTGGIPEIVIDGETGVLVEPGDVEAMAKAIAHLLSDASQLERLGEAGRHRASEYFSWDRTADSLDALLRRHR